MLPVAVLALVAALGWCPASARAQRVAGDLPEPLRVGSEIDFPPFAFGQPGGEASGFTVDLWHAVAREMGVRSEIRVAPFHEILTEFQAGGLDVLINLAQSEERARFAGFSVPHVTMHGAVFVRKGEPPIASPDELVGKSVIVLRDDLAHRWAVARGLGAFLVPVESAARGMRLLSTGTHDALLVGKLVGLQTLRDASIANVVPTGPPLDGFVQKFCFAVRRDQPELLARINEALAVVKANGTYDGLYQKWFGALEPKHADPRLVRIYLALAFGLSSVIGLAFLREHRLRDRLDRSLSLSQASLESTVEGILVVDREGRVSFMNDEFLRMWRIPEDVAASKDDERLLAFALDQLVDPAGFRAGVESLYAHPEIGSFDVIDFRDGRVFERSSRPQRLGTRIVGRVWSFHDVTQRARAEHEARALNVELEARVEDRTRELVSVNEALRSAEARSRLLVESSPTVLYTCRPDGDFATTYVSENVRKQLGYAPEEVTAEPRFWLDRIHPDHVAGVLADLGRVAEETRQTQEYRFRAADGSWRWIQDDLTLIRDESGAPAQIAGARLDLTERKRLMDEIGLRARHAQLLADLGDALNEDLPLQRVLQRCAESMVRHLDAALARVWTLDGAEALLVLRASAGLYTHLDGAHGRIPVGQLKIGWIAQARTAHLTNEVIGDPQVSDQEWARREGIVSFAGLPLVVESRLLGVVALFARQPLVDSTLQAIEGVAQTLATGIARQRAQEDLRRLNQELDERVRQRTQAVEVMNRMLRRGEQQLRQQNEMLLAVTESQAAYLAHGDWREATLRFLTYAIAISQSEYGFFGVALPGPKLRILAYQGVGWDERVGRALRDEAERRVAADGFLDVDALDNLLGAALSSREAIVVDDAAHDARSGGLPEGHPPVGAFLGVPIVVGERPIGLVGLGSRPRGYDAATIALLTPLWRFAAPLCDSYLLGLEQERLRAAQRRVEEDLRLSLREKDTLLREVHHRVKNNLQVISSLLHFEAKKLADPESRAVFAQARDRLRSLTLVHEKLYQSRTLSAIDFADYLRSLLDHLARSHDARKRSIALEVDAKDLVLPIEKALPFGMIVSELVSNAFKYAFPAGRTGRIGVKAALERDRVLVSVWDDGIGLPASFDPTRGTGFGTKLVRNLAEQLDATVEYPPGPGTPPAGTTVRVATREPARAG
ncbi:MAG: transporter substrate-binding domain-containing protein [bacterium]